MFCRNCGQQLADGQKFCHGCGAKITDIESQSSSVSESDISTENDNLIIETPPMAPPAPPMMPPAPPAMVADMGVGSESLPSFYSVNFLGTYFRHYADFSGITTRKRFWLSYLALVVVQLGLMGLMCLSFAVGTVAGIIMFILMTLFSLAILIPTLSLAVRRLRDSGKSPWMILLGLIPFIGSLILLVLFCMPGHSDNIYEEQDDSFQWKASDWIVTLACGVLGVVGPIAFAVNGYASFAESLSSWDYDYEFSTDEYDFENVDSLSDFYGEEAILVEESAIFDTIPDSKDEYSEFYNYLDLYGDSKSYYNGCPAYFYEGSFYNSKNSYPIMLAFVKDNGRYKAVYKNVAYNLSPMDMKIADISENTINLVNSKEGLVIDLEISASGEFSGFATQGSTTLNVYLTPSSKRF